MLTKKIALAAIAGTALLAASGAYARDEHRWGYGPQAGYGQRSHYRRYDRHAQRFVVRPAPAYYYAPEPVYYAPQPAYYAPRPQVVLPGPVLYGTLPIGDARLRFGLQF